MHRPGDLLLLSGIGRHSYSSRFNYNISTTTDTVHQVVVHTAIRSPAFDRTVCHRHRSDPWPVPAEDYSQSATSIPEGVSIPLCHLLCPCAIKDIGCSRQEWSVITHASSNVYLYHQTMCWIHYPLRNFVHDRGQVRPRRTERTSPAFLPTV